MLRIVKIKEVKPYEVVCEFNNGSTKKIDVLPIINNQKHLKGIDSLTDKNIFNTVAIGELGELYWKDIYIDQQNQKWNYDLSPEFVFYNGIIII